LTLVYPAASSDPILAHLIAVAREVSAAGA